MFGPARLAPRARGRGRSIPRSISLRSFDAPPPDKRILTCFKLLAPRFTKPGRLGSLSSNRPSRICHPTCDGLYEIGTAVTVDQLHGPFIERSAPRPAARSWRPWSREQIAFRSAEDLGASGRKAAVLRRPCRASAPQVSA